jgi:hypothetical protein
MIGRIKLRLIEWCEVLLMGALAFAIIIGSSFAIKYALDFIFTLINSMAW